MYILEAQRVWCSNRTFCITYYHTNLHFRIYVQVGIILKQLRFFLWCIQIIMFCHEKYKETDSLKGSLQKERFLYNSSVKKVDHVTFGNVKCKWKKWAQEGITLHLLIYVNAMPFFNLHLQTTTFFFSKLITKYIYLFFFTQLMYFFPIIRQQSLLRNQSMQKPFY